MVVLFLHSLHFFLVPGNAGLLGEYSEDLRGFGSCFGASLRKVLVLLQLRHAGEELGSILCLFLQDSLPPGAARSCSCLPACCVIPACNKLVSLPVF